MALFSEEVEEEYRGKRRRFRRVIRVIERTIDKKGQALLLPDIALEDWWTSLPAEHYSDDEIIALYRDHATSEQFLESISRPIWISSGCPQASSTPTTWCCR